MDSLISYWVALQQVIPGFYPSWSGSSSGRREELGLLPCSPFGLDLGGGVRKGSI